MISQKGLATGPPRVRRVFLREQPSTALRAVPTTELRGVDRAVYSAAQPHREKQGAASPTRQVRGVPGGVLREMQVNVPP